MCIRDRNILKILLLISTPLQVWYVQNSSFACPISSFSCDFTYHRITSSFISTVDTKYPLPKMPFLSQNTFFKITNFLLGDLLVFFLIVSTTLLTSCFGGSTICKFYKDKSSRWFNSVSYTHLRAHETRHDLVCRLLLEK